MAQRMFHESGQDGRSVLGMLAVQVERDPKTGATVVRSVTPFTTSAGAPNATTVFDDGRKSVHTVCGSGGPPSTEELGQILSVIDGVGMKALLDKVTLMPNKAEMKTENVEASKMPKEKVLSFSIHHAMSKENNMQLGSCRSYDLEAELNIDDCALSVGDEEDKKEDRSIMAVIDMAGKVDNMEDQRLEEGPVNLVFLGYNDATTGQDHSQEDDEGRLTVEQVIITEDGEEHVIGPEMSSSSPTLDKLPGQEAGKKSQDEVFQDIPLDGNGEGVKIQGENGDKGLHNSSSPSVAEGEGTSKRKTCQCCSVM
ncbi:uncharacterized protein LOC120788174 [Xiphias gladius]|uniref:uncharacterized protein LOC120788174 n=1 Tax=Xiphias gladius TaxID=8245 RepID=UPI001A98F54E|nr:uncharacterized protein LOC120788174 [Xiphias gladius]